MRRELLRFSPRREQRRCTTSGGKSPVPPEEELSSPGFPESLECPDFDSKSPAEAGL